MTSLAKRTIGFLFAWFGVVAATILTGNLMKNEALGERLVNGALWPLPSITYALSRAVDLVGETEAAEPASSYLGPGGVRLGAIVATVLYVCFIVVASNLAARVTLRRRLHENS